MRYYKQIESGYIIAIGIGGGGTEITEQEYSAILEIIRDKPSKTSTTDFRLSENLTWEEYPCVEPEPNPEPPENIFESAVYLLSENVVELPEEEEPDYLNENEPEPDYFA